MITNITSTTGHSYVPGELITGTTLYSDRTYQATSVPAFLSNAPFIKTSNDDKASKATSVLSFDLTQNATVYIGYDPRGTTIPSWLNSWQKLSSQIGINDPVISYMVLYSKSLPAGHVTLGGNLVSPAVGAKNNYLVMALTDGSGIQYTLSATTSGSGTISKNPDQTTYANGSSVTLTATPEAGQQFTGWSGDATGSINPLSVIMNTDKSITATFAPIEYTLTVSSNGVGTVSKSPDQTTYTSGSGVFLTATPGAGQQFSGWSGDAAGSVNPLNITVNSNENITANFVPVPSALITNITTTSGRSYALSELIVGTTLYTDRTYQATSVPAFLNNAPFIKTPNDDKTSTASSLLSFDLSQNATVYVAYDPRGSKLPAWLSTWQKELSHVGINDPVISNMNLYSKSFAAGHIILGGNLASPATGAKDNYFVIALAQGSIAQYNLTVNTSGNGTITKNPDQTTYASGSSVTLTATPAAGQQFSGWSGDATGTVNPLTISMDADKSVTGTFITSTTGQQATVTPLSIYDNDVSGGAAGINRTVTVTNTGSGVLTLSSASLSGINASQFVLSGLPVFPKDISAGASISFSVAFNPSSTGLKTAVININSNDAVNPVVAVALRGLGTSGLGGANEPSLQAILNLLEVQVNVGDDNAFTAVINSDAALQKAPVLGEEISIQQFKKSGSGPVTITPLAVFGPTDNSTIVGMGWYKSGNPASTSELFTVSNTPLSNGQTVNVNYTGVLSFDPASDTFGFYSRWPFFDNRHLYSEDKLNTFTGAIPHHVRVYAYKKNGISVADTYLVTFEEHISGFDYQDIIFVVSNVKPAPASTTLTILPLADAYVRDGGSAATNYGNDGSLVVKSSSTSGSSRFSYLKFPLGASLNAGKISSAKLRLYGYNTESTANIALSAFGLEDDSWTEGGITFNNAPAASLTANLSSVSVNDQPKYYEFDVTDFVKFQASGDKVAGFFIKDPGLANKSISFNSKENAQNPPQLVVDTATVIQSNASLFVENPDQFPSNNDFVFSRVQIPWTRDSVYNANHDSLKVRNHNKGLAPLVIRNLTLSNDTTWKIDKLNGVTYVAASAFPVSISSGTFIDVTLKFIAMNQAFRAKVLHETLTITSNDDKNPLKTVFLHGLWQKSGEGGNEPYAQEMINAFGFTTRTGFTPRDPDLGDSTKLKGHEIKPSFFVRADPSLPVSIRQMGAYHTCCHKSETIRWYVKGSSTLSIIFTHSSVDGQTLLPRKGLPSSPASGTINPTTAFGFKIGGTDWTDATQNPGDEIGIRVWKAFDFNGNIIPNSYIIANDYLGSDATNYDYNDNMYFVSNIKPEVGAAWFSTLGATPSALDFGEKILQTTNSLPLSIKNLGQTYSNGSSDTAITISSINITGENRFEFSADMPLSTTLAPQQTSTITVRFKPVSQGLKIADLLIYYNNSLGPLRVPLYGIARAADTTVIVNYRIKGGYATPLTVNGKTWSADSSGSAPQYAFDNLEPYSNPALSQIAATDEDSLYLREQSSNADKKPFRYQMSLPNGNYVVRLHFAEIYWGLPDKGLNKGLAGGAGSRVMSVKLENQLRLINFDIAQEVGPAAAIVKNFPVTVTDQQLNIDFSATVNRPMVSAVEVYSFVAASQRPANTATLSLATTNENVKVFPNPLHNSFNIEFPGKYRGITTIEIIDLPGRIYQAGKINLKGEKQTMKVDISRLKLAPGVYFIKINAQGLKSDVIKVLVQ